MSRVRIRPAEAKDARQIAEVHVKTWQCVYRGQIPDAYLDSLSIEKRTETWKKQIEEPEKGIHILVVELHGRVIGWCSFGVSRDDDAYVDTGELMGIYMHPNFMGKGYGSILMDSALTLLKQNGYKKATLWVLDTNEKTRKWYESKGWRVEGKTKVDKRDSFELKETRYIIDL